MQRRTRSESSSSGPTSRTAGNPTFDWQAEGDAISVSIDGLVVTAEGTFTDAAVGLPDREGTLTATCPSWYEG